MSSNIIRQCSRRIFLWCAFLETLIIGGLASHLTDTWVGRGIGSLLMVCMILGIVFVIPVLMQSPSRVIRELQAELVSGEDSPEVLASVCRFSEMAGIPTVKAYQTTAAQVTTLSVGWSPASSVIILNCRALEVLTPEERDSVIAVEIAHIKFRDHLLRSIVMFTGLGCFVYWSMSQPIVEAYRDTWEDIKRSRYSHALSVRRLFYLFGIIVAPLFGLMILMCGIPIRAIVAEQEYRADAWSAQAVGSVVPPANAISKLAATIVVRKNYLRDYSVFCMVEPKPRDWMQSVVFACLYPTCVTRIKRLRACMHGLD